MRDAGDCLLDESGLGLAARELSTIWPRPVGFDQHPIDWQHSGEFLIAIAITDLGGHRDEVAGVDYGARRLLVGFVPMKNRAPNFRVANYCERLGGAPMGCVEDQREIHFCRDSSKTREPRFRARIDIGVVRAFAVPWQADFSDCTDRIALA